MEKARDDHRVVGGGGVYWFQSNAKAFAAMMTETGLLVVRIQKTANTQGDRQGGRQVTNETLRKNLLLELDSDPVCQLVGIGHRAPGGPSLFQARFEFNP